MNELDEITVKSAAKGDKKSFKKVYDHYSSFVWKVIFRTVNGDREAAEKILQDVFIKVYRKLSSFKFSALFSTWLYRITFNETLLYLNKKKKQNERVVPFNDSIGKEEKNEPYENRELVSMILKKLTPKERFLLVAREINDIPFEDLAEITGQKAGALRTQLHRIKENIKKHYTSVEILSGEY